MDEVWKDISGFEEFYQISNMGRVRSLDRKSGKTPIGCDRVIKGKVLKPYDNGKGYKIISLKKNGRRSSKYVHRLVAEAYLKKPYHCNVVDHIDFNKSNNCVDNLQWSTQKDNVRRSSCNMSVPHKSQTNTGEKYISLKGKAYCVNIKNRRVYKSFECLEDAVCFRNEVLNEIGHAI